MSENWIYITSELLVTYWIHSSIFVGAALIALKLKKIAPDALGESLLKLSLLLAIVTSSLQVFQPFELSRSLQLLNTEWQVQAAPNLTKPRPTSLPVPAVESVSNNVSAGLKQ